MNATTPPHQPQVENHDGQAESYAAIQAMVAAMRQRQSLPLAILAGTAAAIVSAIIWAAITLATDMQIGWMAVGVGFAVGIAVRVLGKGIDPVFSYLGAALALFGCLLGNLFTIFGFLAKQEGIPVTQVLMHIDYSLIPELMAATFSPIDLLFYAIAIYQGYKLSVISV